MIEYLKKGPEFYFQYIHTQNHQVKNHTSKIISVAQTVFDGCIICLLVLTNTKLDE